LQNNHGNHANQVNQIWISVISQWVKEKNIREVQYMAGHTSIYSTQRYIRANLDDLKDELSIYHPLM
jgi:integrase/recombinase XerD